MKPYVICHMCTTTDGRILTDRWPRLPGRASAAASGAATPWPTAARAGSPSALCGDDHVDLKVALDKLRRVLGIRRLKLERGVNWFRYRVAGIGRRKGQ